MSIDPAEVIRNGLIAARTSLDSAVAAINSIQPVGPSMTARAASIARAEAETARLWVARALEELEWERRGLAVVKNTKGAE